jgi:hypothetical protein
LIVRLDRDGFMIVSDARDRYSWAIEHRKSLQLHYDLARSRKNRIRTSSDWGVEPRPQKLPSEPLPQIEGEIFNK